MGESQSDLYKRKQNYLSEVTEDGKVTQGEKDAIEELCFTFDEQRPAFNRPNWPDAPSRLRSYRSKSTLSNWMYQLTRIALAIDLMDTSATEINRLMGEWLRGEGDVKDDGLTKGSLRAFQNTLRIFYRYHDDVNVDFQSITVFDQEDTSVKPSDMLTPDEVQMVRDVPTNPRDEVVVYLLLYTGVRNTALRKLRVRDVELNPNPRYYFNTTAEGLKGVSRPHEPRPLLGAESAVRTWLNFHPTGNDDDYLITARSKWGRGDASEPVSYNTIGRVMDTVKEETGIDKPMHPHMMRHNFVSICKREYGMDDDAVKFLIGHDPDSTVMSTTYAHLSGEDYAQKAEVAAGIRDQEESSFSPEEYCTACGEPLPENAKACSACGMTYTPDARSVLQDFDGDAREALVNMNDDELRELIATFDEDVTDNVDAIDVLIEAREKWRD